MVKFSLQSGEAHLIVAVFCLQWMNRIDTLIQRTPSYGEVARVFLLGLQTLERIKTKLIAGQNLSDNDKKEIAHYESQVQSASQAQEVAALARARPSLSQAALDALERDFRTKVPLWNFPQQEVRLHP